MNPRCEADRKNVTTQDIESIDEVTTVTGRQAIYPSKRSRVSEVQLPWRSVAMLSCNIVSSKTGARRYGEWRLCGTWTLCCKAISYRSEEQHTSVCTEMLLLLPRRMNECAIYQQTRTRRARLSIIRSRSTTKCSSCVFSLFSLLFFFSSS